MSYRGSGVRSAIGTLTPRGRGSMRVPVGMTEDPKASYPVFDRSSPSPGPKDAFFIVPGRFLIPTLR
jgi:hypothetical protein